MKKYGYARVSTKDQDNAIQREALMAAGCDVIREEKASGTSREGRAQLDILLAFISAGDTLIVTRIDRLARSGKDLQDIAHALREKGAHLKVIEQPIDTTTSAGKLFYDMLGAFAEFEAAIRYERQMEGIAKAKLKGIFKGRKASIDPQQVRTLLAAGLTPSQAAKELGVSRMSVYRLGGLIAPKPDPVLTLPAERAT